MEAQKERVTVLVDKAKKQAFLELLQSVDFARVEAVDESFPSNAPLPEADGSAATDGPRRKHFTVADVRGISFHFDRDELNER